MATKLAIIGDQVKLFKTWKVSQNYLFKGKYWRIFSTKKKKTYKNKNLEKESMDTENRL